MFAYKMEKPYSVYGEMMIIRSHLKVFAIHVSTAAALPFSYSSYMYTCSWAACHIMS